MFKRLSQALGAELPEWAMFVGFGTIHVRLIDYACAKLELPLWFEAAVIVWELFWLLIGIVCVTQVIRSARKTQGK